MIPVSAITSYMYCPRKFYMNYVLGLKEPARKPTVEGTIMHQALDRMQEGINGIMSKTSESTTLQDLEISYKKAYYLGLFNSINSNEQELKRLNISKTELFKKLWQQLSEESAKKAELVFETMKMHKAYGKELLEKIRANTEVMLTSEILGLRGIADRTEEREGKVTVYEAKTGKAPKDGMWDNHKIQLAAYMMIIKENGQKEVEGILEYGSDKRKLVLNPFIEDEVRNLIKTVKTIIETRKVPNLEISKNKCVSCGLKSYCDYLH